MEQPISFEELGNPETIPLCQACLERAATETCQECGCPLCHECSEKHICNQDEDEFVYRNIRQIPKGQIPN